MTIAVTTPRFKENVHGALHDERLQGALLHARNFIGRRKQPFARVIWPPR